MILGVAILILSLNAIRRGQLKVRHIMLKILYEHRMYIGNGVQYLMP